MKQDAVLKILAAAKDTAGVYINRNELLGATIKINEALDGASIGQTAANTDLNREVKREKHTFTSKVENDSSVEVDAKPGTLIYILQGVKIDLMSARSKRYLVGPVQR